MDLHAHGAAATQYSRALGGALASPAPCQSLWYERGRDGDLDAVAQLGPEAQIRRAPENPQAIQIRDDEGRIVSVDVAGEIWSRAERPRKYWNGLEATAATWQDGWLRTGDIGFIDSDGDLIICAQKSSSSAEATT
ncbi:MAG TPA: hypothetical protein VHY34_08940 [Caulobacteraceae bacterium]|nr:hypothetical protein [Caulobacteraceae bacterium]